MNRTFNLLVASASLLLICRSANAYIDAGSGSYLLQILFAGLLGGIFAAKAFFLNIKSAMSRKFQPAKVKDNLTDAG